MRRDIQLASGVLGALALPVLIVWVSIHVSLATFTYSSEQSDVLTFIEGRGDLPPIFNSREIYHLWDVRRVFVNFLSGALISLCLTLVSIILHRRGRISISSYLKWGAISSILIPLLIGICVLIDFRTTFSLLHYPFFEPGTWSFPRGSTLTTLFPVRYFEAVIKRTLTCWLILASLSLWMAKRVRKEQNPGKIERP